MWLYLKGDLMCQLCDVQRWAQFVREVDPDIITGYNIQNFDLSYLLTRAKHLHVDDFCYLGRVKNIQSVVRNTTLQSKQLGKRENKSINIDGRVQFDLLLVSHCAIAIQDLCCDCLDSITLLSCSFFTMSSLWGFLCWSSWCELISLLTSHVLNLDIHKWYSTPMIILYYNSLFCRDFSKCNCEYSDKRQLISCEVYECVYCTDLAKTCLYRSKTNTIFF